MYDNEKDRRADSLISESTVSLWLYLESNRNVYTNPLYERYNKAITTPIGVHEDEVDDLDSYCGSRVRDEERAVVAQRVVAMGRSGRLFESFAEDSAARTVSGRPSAQGQPEERCE